MDQRPSRLSSLGIHLDGADHNPLTTLCCHGAVPGLKRPQPPWGSQCYDTRAKSTTFVTPMSHQLEQAGKSDSAASRTLTPNRHVPALGKPHERTTGHAFKDAERRQATGSSSHGWLDEATRNRMFRWSRPTKRGEAREARRAIRQVWPVVRSWDFPVTLSRLLTKMTDADTTAHSNDELRLNQNLEQFCEQRCWNSRLV